MSNGNVSVRVLAADELGCRTVVVGMECSLMSRDIVSLPVVLMVDVWSAGSKV
jgi:hypothetical protein